MAERVQRKDRSLNNTLMHTGKYLGLGIDWGAINVWGRYSQKIDDGYKRLPLFSLVRLSWLGCVGTPSGRISCRVQVEIKKIRPAPELNN